MANAPAWPILGAERPLPVKRHAMRLVQRLGLLYLGLVSLAIARNVWGDSADLIVAGMVLLVGAVSWLVLHRQDRATRQMLATLPLEQQIAAIKADPETRDVAAGDVFGNERRDWNWQFAHALGPWLGLLYLPILYLIVARQHENGLVVMGLAVLGVLTWRWWARRYLREYRCRTCGAGHLPVISLRPVRYVCVRCATTWRL